MTAAAFLAALEPSRDARWGALAGVVRVDLLTAGTSTFIDFDNGSVTAQHALAPRIIVRAHDADFMALVQGRMSAQDGVLSGRLHVAGEATAIAALFQLWASPA